MQITFLLPPLNNTGGIRVIATYAAALQRLGHLVTVVSVPRPEMPLKGKIKSVMSGNGWPASQKHATSHFDRTGVRVHTIDRWRPICDRDVPDADVVVATWWETAEWAKRLSPQKGAKVYFVQGDERVVYPPGDDRIEQVRQTWSLPMHKITISRWLAKLLASASTGHAIDIVANSVDSKLFFAPPRNKNEVTTIGFVYSESWFRGIDIVLKALDLARRDVPNLRVVAFGHDALRIKMNADYSQNPPQDQIREIYSQCDAWLFGSRMEGFGLPILEAMACRTPVIAAPSGAAPEILDRGGGILVKPEDPADMAAAIVKIHRMSAHRWKALSDAALANATRYSWDDATMLFEGALRKASLKTEPHTQRPALAS